MKFRKKPVIIDALQWNGSNVDDCMKFISDGNENFNHLPDDGQSKLKGVGYISALGILEIPTLEGVMQAKANDWIIRGVKGEFYPCKPDIFEATYEKV